MKNENDYLDKLFSADIDIPESLSPQNIEKRLIEYNETNKDKVRQGDIFDISTANKKASKINESDNADIDSADTDNIDTNTIGSNNTVINYTEQNTSHPSAVNTTKDTENTSNPVNPVNPVNPDNSGKVIKLDLKRKKQLIHSAVAAVLLLSIMITTVFCYNRGWFIGTKNKDSNYRIAANNKSARKNLNEAYQIAIKNYNTYHSSGRINMFNSLDGKRTIQSDDIAEKKSIDDNTSGNSSGIGYNSEGNSGISKGNIKGSTSDSKSNDYTTTNVRTDGVDEVEIVKTDGKNIYEYNKINNTISISEVNGEDVTPKATIDLSIYNLEVNKQGFYIQDGKLVITGTTSTYDSYQSYDDGVYTEESYSESEIKGNTSSKGGTGIINNYSSATNPASKSSVKPDKEFKDYYKNHKDDEDVKTANVITRALIFDVNDNKNIKFLKGFFQEGIYTDSRLKNGYLYLFSSRTMLTQKKPRKADLKSYIPKFSGKCANGNDLIIQKDYKSLNYTLISSISLKSQKMTDKKAILGSGLIYVASNNIYICDNSGHDKTNIMRVGYKKGKLSFLKRGEISGRLKDDYCIDEYKGYLRLVTTVNNASGISNGLIILNKNLKECGSIKNLAKNEQIYSARFMGDTAYFVTYRNTDPLFAVDVSNPEKPKLLSYLKIPGFSTYLHPLSDGLLLGIGREDESTTIGTDDTIVSQGLKISLFDITDPKDVREIDKRVYYGYSEATTNPNAIFFDEKNKLFGLSATITDLETYTTDSSLYQVFSYDKDKGIIEKYKDHGDRMLRINDYLYLVSIGQYIKVLHTDLLSPSV